MRTILLFIWGSRESLVIPNPQTLMPICDTLLKRLPVRNRPQTLHAIAAHTGTNNLHPPNPENHILAGV
jgi:hypothetical protein